MEKQLKESKDNKCPNCDKTFPENLGTLYYNSHLDSDEVHTILQSHAIRNKLRYRTECQGKRKKVFRRIEEK